MLQKCMSSTQGDVCLLVWAGLPGAPRMTPCRQPEPPMIGANGLPSRAAKRHATGSSRRRPRCRSSQRRPSQSRFDQGSRSTLEKPRSLLSLSPSSKHQQMQDLFPMDGHRGTSTRATERVHAAAGRHHLRLDYRAAAACRVTSGTPGVQRRRCTGGCGRTLDSPRCTRTCRSCLRRCAATGKSSSTPARRRFASGFR